MQFNPDATSLPLRRHLPAIPGSPEGAAWFWGKDDELGRLNLLTPARTAAAAKLVESGQVVNLNLPAELPDPPMFGREPFKFTIKSLGPAGNDDLHSLNTQSGSQWDGFRHTTSDDITQTSRCGIQAWANHGIVSRGVLLDFWAYAGKSYDPNTTHPISLPDLLACAKRQNIEFRYGDILIIRTGWVDVYKRMSMEERRRLGSKAWAEQTFVGVEQSTEMADFLHDQYFSAVASDAPGFESWPTDKAWNHHENLLPLWGVPIGETWDLERLAEACHSHQRWEFFFTSIPTNVSGGVGSYSNALAIF
ncbi:putative cyclase-domain-containing protein [Aspergillus unguis]